MSSMKITRKVLFLAVFAAFLFSAGLACADEKVRIGVLQFESKASGVSDQQAEIIMDLLTRELASSKTIAVYERAQLKQAVGAEVKLGMSGLVDPSTAAEVGRVAGVQYILLGAVTDLSKKASGGAIPLFGSVGIATGSEEAMTTIDIRLIDTSTSEIRLALSETGRSANEVTGLTIGGAVIAEGTFDGLESRAIADAVKRLAYRIKDTLTGETSHVVGIKDNEVMIDVGSTMGAKEGSLYLVYADGKEIRGMDNESIGREKLAFALIKIRDIAGNFSTCTFVKGSKTDMVRRGDKIEPISSANAKKVKYASARPAASSSTYEALFGSKPQDGEASEPSASGTSETLQPDDKKPTEQVQQPAADKKAPAEAKKIDGFDPNTSTDSKVIQTYPITPGQVNIIGIMHRNAYNAYKNGNYKKAYEGFSKAADADAKVNYLSAYWAGVAANKLKKNDDSLSWINKALAINPNYKPAQEFKTKTLKK